MDEKEETNEVGEEQKAPEKDNNAENKYETTPLIERARQEREKLDAANTKKEELLNREEEIMAKRALGGVTELAAASVEKKETDAEFFDRVKKDGINLLKD